MQSESSDRGRDLAAECATLETLFRAAVVRGIGGVLCMVAVLLAATVPWGGPQVVLPMLLSSPATAVGALAISLLGLYAACALIYWKIPKNESGHRHFRANDLPVLNPLPIATKKRHALLQPLIWIFSVRQWEVGANWTYRHSDGSTFVVPGGFLFDGASVPRVFWALLHPAGLLLVSGLIHDYAYRHEMLWRLVPGTDDQLEEYGPLSKKAADCLFWEVGGDVNGVWAVNSLAFLGVWFGARGVWRNHRKANIPPTLPEGFRRAEAVASR